MNGTTQSTFVSWPHEKNIVLYDDMPSEAKHICINNIHTVTNGLCNAVVSDTTFYADGGLPLGQYENIPMVLDRVVKVLTKMPKCKGTKKHMFVSNALHAVIFKCN